MMVIDGIPPTLNGCCQTLEELVVSLGVAALFKAGLITDQGVFESHWSWAEGTFGVSL